MEGAEQEDSPPHSRNIRGHCLQIIQNREAKKGDREEVMPRRVRLDLPGTFHHVILRGIERKRCT